MRYDHIKRMVINDKRLSNDDKMLVAKTDL